METRKLYYEDCHLRRFAARVEACWAGDGGYFVTLDQTAFYPEGGGQACDIGTLGEARVLDVQEREGKILHLCDRPLTSGTEAVGEINWARRFDQMQQHAGEHILSGLLHTRFGCQNSGFHVGAELVTVDFDRPVPPEALEEIEALANEKIWENTALHCWYPSPEELPHMVYRTKRALPWPVRIVEIPGADACACCGVHVAHTGEIGLLKIFSCVKFHQGVRLEIACGGRAYRLLSQLCDQNRRVSQAFSAKPLETAAAAQRMKEALAAEKFRANGLQRQVFTAVAKAYAGQENALHFADDLDPAGLRELAVVIAGEISGVAAVFVPGAAGCSLCLAGESAAVKALGSALNRELNARGGGKPGFFQGSVPAEKAEIEAFFATQAFL